MLHDFLQSSARRLGEKVAFAIGDQRATYAQIDRASNQLAHALRRRGVRRGDRVVVFAENAIETAVSFWGALKANAVVSVVNPLTKAAKLRYLLDDCAATALLADAHLWPTVTAVAPGAQSLRSVLCIGGKLDDAAVAAVPHAERFDQALAAEDGSAPPRRECIDVDLAAIVYTSGSTGDAKGVMLTHRNMLTAAESISTYLGLREDDVILCALPMAFDYGLYQMIMAFRMGAQVVAERSFAYPAQVLNQMMRWGVTVFPGVPTMFAMLSDMRLDSYDFSKVRAVTNTAAALPVKHIRRSQEIFPKARVFSMYGLTECKRCTYLPPEDLARKPESVGIAIPNTELWLVDEQDRKLPPGSVGQLVIRGATVMRGYWGKPESTAKKLKPGPLPGEMVLYTGDLCRLDEEGYLYFVARMDDIIKSRGEKVAPKEVEAALVDIAGVREAAVIGVPDEVLGQAVKAFVVLEAGVTLTEKDIRREAQKRLENFMVPQLVEIVGELPRGATGKVQKSALR